MKDKGLDAPTMIGIIVAVIAAALIIYFLWSKGLLPFLGGVTEAQCKDDLLKSCNNQLEWEKISKLCVNYFRGTEKSNLETCLANPTSNEIACNDFCSSLLSGR
jgi:hypothetical protein